jgi:hypothetical protein
VGKEGTLKKLLLAGVAAGALALGAPVAQADHVGYEGPGCTFNTLNDTTPGGQIGGQNQWTGEAAILAIATDAAGVPNGASITVECEMFINGNSQGVYLATSGTGIAATTYAKENPGGVFSFSAADTDVVTVCDNVTIDGHFIQNCSDAETTQIVPQPVVDAINLAIDTLNSTVLEQIDPTICPFIGMAAPGVPGVVDITPEGDVFVVTELWYDCPPYVEA